MAIQWTNALSTGVEQIDEQHKELFKRVNELLNACNCGKGKEEVGEVLAFLGDYVVTHFGNEEKYMKKYDYPGYAGHKALHTAFIDDFSKIKNEFEQKGPGNYIVLKTNKVVVNWLINHISKLDKMFGAFLKEKVKENRL